MKNPLQWATSLGRCTLHLRLRDHGHPERKGKGETIVEVRRDGEVLATIYGSREGVHIVSELAPANGSFLAEGWGPSPAIIVPLLKPTDACPWCEDTGKVTAMPGVDCPVCKKRRAEK